MKKGVYPSGWRVARWSDVVRAYVDPGRAGPHPGEEQRQHRYAMHGLHAGLSPCKRPCRLSSERGVTTREVRQGDDRPSSHPCLLVLAHNKPVLFSREPLGRPRSGISCHHQRKQGVGRSGHDDTANIPILLRMRLAVFPKVNAMLAPEGAILGPRVRGLEPNGAIIGSALDNHAHPPAPSTPQAPRMFQQSDSSMPRLRSQAQAYVNDAGASARAGVRGATRVRCPCAVGVTCACRARYVGVTCVVSHWCH